MTQGYWALSRAVSAGGKSSLLKSPFLHSFITITQKSYSPDVWYLRHVGHVAHHDHDSRTHSLETSKPSRIDMDGRNSRMEGNWKFANFCFVVVFLHAARRRRSIDHTSPHVAFSSWSPLEAKQTCRGWKNSKFHSNFFISFKSLLASSQYQVKFLPEESNPFNSNSSNPFLKKSNIKSIKL